MFTHIINLTSVFYVLYMFVSYTIKTHNTKLTINNKISLILIEFCTATLMELLRDRIGIFYFVIYIVTLVYIYRKVIHCTKSYTIINMVLIYIILSLTDTFLLLITSTVNIFVAKDTDTLNFIAYIYVGLRVFISVALTSLIFYYIRKSKNFKYIADSFSSRDISVLIIITFSIFIPDTLKCNTLTLDYNFSIISISILELLKFIIIITLYFKYNICYSESQNELKNEKIYNKTLTELVDSLRILKHDYDNIIQSINGYIITKQYDLLEEHMKKLSSETLNISNIQSLSPEIINQPAIYGIIGAKYFLATRKNISFKLSVLTNINEICFDFSDLSRILGILLDNAIEASEKTNNPHISLTFSYNSSKNATMIEIKNSIVENTQIDTNKIFNKGYSSKKVKSGLGLWEVRKIISSSNNSQIFAEVKNNEFCQTIIIEQI